MKTTKIRPLALAIIKNGNKILVTPGVDKKKKENFYRIPGGGIEFGETAFEALAREFIEEFDTKLKNIKYLGLLENIFTYESDDMHEIIFVFEAVIARKELLKQDLIRIIDQDNAFAIWEDVKVLKMSRFYPEGIVKYIK